MIIQKHYESLESTQDKAKEILKENSEDNLLISCDHQSAGYGRQSKKWIFSSGSLAFSFTLIPSKTLTLTPLEIGVHVVSYLENQFGENILLKWPNDLLTKDNKKCGGILCEYIDGKVLVGIGVNCGPLEIKKAYEFDYPPASLNLAIKDKKNFCLNFYNYINQNRLSDSLIISSWTDLCIHQNKPVEIIDCNKSVKGIFIGIGNAGEGLVKCEKKSHKFITGSLRF